jgi:hypothetical protein
MLSISYSWDARATCVNKDYVASTNILISVSVPKRQVPNFPVFFGTFCI